MADEPTPKEGEATPKNEATPKPPVEPVAPNAFDINSLMSEIMEEEKAARAAQEKKIQELKDGSLNPEQVKEALKGVLKNQAKSLEDVKTAQAEQIKQLQEQLDNISNGTKAPKQVEGEPFKAPKGEQTREEMMAELKEKDYNLYALKHFGVLK